MRSWAKYEVIDLDACLVGGKSPRTNRFLRNMQRKCTLSFHKKHLTHSSCPASKSLLGQLLTHCPVPGCMGRRARHVKLQLQRATKISGAASGGGKSPLPPAVEISDSVPAGAEGDEGKKSDTEEENAGGGDGEERK